MLEISVHYHEQAGCILHYSRAVVYVEDLMKSRIQRDRIGLNSHLRIVVLVTETGVVEVIPRLSKVSERRRAGDPLLWETLRNEVTICRNCTVMG